MDRCIRLSTTYELALQTARVLNAEWGSQSVSTILEDWEEQARYVDYKSHLSKVSRLSGLDIKELEHHVRCVSTRFPDVSKELAILLLGLDLGIE